MQIPRIPPPNIWTFTKSHALSGRDYWRLSYKIAPNSHVDFKLGYGGNLLNVLTELTFRERNRDPATMKLVWETLYPNNTLVRVLLPYREPSKFVLSVSRSGTNTSVELDHADLATQEAIHEKCVDFWDHCMLRDTKEKYPICHYQT